jgi:hypothetical protein
MSGITTIHFTAKRYDIAIISRFLDTRADINILDSKSKILLDYVDRNLNRNITIYILGHSTITRISKDII